MMDEATIQKYWQGFLVTLPPNSPYAEREYHPEAWGDSPEMADELGELIAAGTKTATCSALWEWEAEGESPPETGTVTVVVNGSGEPLCIVETVEVTIRRFNEVDANFAREEGEGDLSLRYWRDAHRRFFSRSLPKIGREFCEEMPLVCERFRLVHR